MKTVRDIMSPLVLCLEESAYLPEAARLLHKHGISGAPVINASGEYVGVFSKSDLSTRLAASFAEDGGLDKEASLEELGGTEWETLRVRELMTPEVFKIPVGASLEELGQSLLIADVHRFMVEEDGKIIGLVTTSDLIHGFLSGSPKPAKSPMKIGHKPYLFEADLTLNKGTIRYQAGFGPELLIEAPEEFGGTGQHVSPEDLFVGSISSCLGLTFSIFAEKEGLVINSYECRAIGRLEGDGTALRFSRIDLYPKIEVKEDLEKTERLLAQAKLRCLVGRSTDVHVALHPKISVEKTQEI